MPFPQVSLSEQEMLDIRRRFCIPPVAAGGDPGSRSRVPLSLEELDSIAVHICSIMDSEDIDAMEEYWKIFLATTREAIRRAIDRRQELSGHCYSMDPSGGFRERMVLANYTMCMSNYFRIVPRVSCLHYPSLLADISSRHNLFPIRTGDTPRQGGRHGEHGERSHLQSPNSASCWAGCGAIR